MSLETESDESQSVSEPEKDGRPNPKFWIAQLSASKDAGKTHRDQTRKSIDEYLAFTTKATADVQAPANDSRYPIWWSTLKTVQPAIYSRTPIPVARKAFEDLDDAIARQSGIYLERLAEYLVRCNPFDRVHYVARDFFLWADKTTTRVRFDGAVKTTTVKTRYTPTQTIDDHGESVMIYRSESGEDLAEGQQLYEDEDGSYYAETESEEIDYAKVTIEPCFQDDELHTPNARTSEEVDWRAYKALMTRSDVKERFDKEDETFSDRLTYVPLGETDKDQKGDRKSTAETYCTVWEIWDKRKRRVMWLAEGFDEDFLDIKEDPYSLVGFFPSPPHMLGTCGPDSLYPVPAYIQMEPFINQLHGAAKTLQVYIRALRKRGFADASVGELDRLLNDVAAGEFLMIQNFEQLVKDGGLENIVKFFPTGEYSKAVSELIAASQDFENKFNELYGVPDILRGVSDPRETAAAQQQKGKYISLRFSAIQTEFQRLCRDGIELMCDLALKKFPEQKLIEIMGIQFEKPENQQIWPQCLALMQNDEQRMVRIDIETDSTITMNQNAEIEQMQYLTKTVTDGIRAIGEVAQNAPDYLPVAAESVRQLIGSLQQGKRVEGSFNQAWKQAQQPKPQAPDPAMQKVQAQIQVEQQKAQAQVQVAQMKAQTDAQLAMQKAQIEMELERRQAEHKMQLEQQDAMNQQQLAAVEAQTAVIKAQMEAQIQEKKAEDQATTAKMKVIGDLAAKKAQGVPEKGPAAMTINFKPLIHGKPE